MIFPYILVPTWKGFYFMTNVISCNWWKKAIFPFLFSIRIFLESSNSVKHVAHCSLGRTLDILKEEKIKTDTRFFIYAYNLLISPMMYMGIRKNNFLLKISTENELKYSVLSF